MENETWLPVQGWENYYQVSNLGRVKSIARVVGKKHLKERILGGGIDSDGYHIVSLYKDGKGHTRTVHRLVCSAFNPKPSQATNVVCHLDDNRLNNDASNLMWGTIAENNQQCCDRNRNCKGTKNGSNIISPFQAFIIQESSTKSTKIIAKSLGLALSTVYGIRYGTTWSWL